MMQLWEDGVWKPDVERDGRANTEGTEEWWVEELAEEEPTEEDSWCVRVHGGPQVLRERAGTETGKVINIRCDTENVVMSEAHHWRAWEEDRSVDGDSVETVMGSDSEGQPRGRGRDASGEIIIGELGMCCGVCEMWINGWEEYLTHVGAKKQTERDRAQRRGIREQRRHAREASRRNDSGD